MSDQETSRSIDTKIEAGVLSVRFDGGYWNVATHGVAKILSVRDLGGDPRAGSVTYRNAWGLEQTADFFLKAPKRLG